MLVALLAAPLFIQGVFMMVDEFYFHRQRGLPLWERVGHPLDSLSVLLCYLFIWWQPPTPTNVSIYIGLCVFSCLLVTKDEFVHTEVCSAKENWLHAVLFILHPITFFCAGIVWKYGLNTHILVLQLIVIAVFLLYQIWYWLVLAKEKSVVNNKIYNDYGDRWYEADDDPVALLRAESRTKTPWILDKLREKNLVKATTQILDVGCGAGFLTNALALKNLSVTGVDLSSESIEVAKRYDVTKSVKYLVADAYNLPFPDQSFDVLTAMDFLEHVNDPQKVVEEFARVLKPGGVFVFHTFNRNWLSYIVIIKAVEWLVKNTPKHMHVLHLFIKPKELQHYCMMAGMQPDEMIGIKPVFSSIPIKNLFTGRVPKSLRFEFTQNLLLSYMGLAVKT